MKYIIYPFLTLELDTMADTGNELCFGFILLMNTLIQPLKSAEIKT